MVYSKRNEFTAIDASRAGEGMGKVVTRGSLSVRVDRQEQEATRSSST